MSSGPRVLSAGQTVGGRYRIEAELGRGGMGIVYGAVHVHTARRVAIKVIRHALAGDARTRERLFIEARSAASVRHPNIVDILDMGSDGDELYLVMERLEGRTLEAELQERGRLPCEQALAWLLPIMDALSVLHEAGVIHRDVKPGNILLSRTRTGVVPKLLDFGLARGPSDARLTDTGVVIGTPWYMAPEHVAGEAIGAAADVWSLGVVLYECLAGVGPYPSLDREALAAHVLLGRVRPLLSACPTLAAPLASAVDRALKRDLGLRYRSMREMAQCLVAAAGSSAALPEDLALAEPAPQRALRLAPTEPCSVPEAAGRAEADLAIEPRFEVTGARAPLLGPVSSTRTRRARKLAWRLTAALLICGLPSPRPYAAEARARAALHAERTRRDVEHAPQAGPAPLAPAAAAALGLPAMPLARAKSPLSAPVSHDSAALKNRSAKQGSRVREPPSAPALPVAQQSAQPRKPAAGLWTTVRDEPGATRGDAPTSSVPFGAAPPSAPPGRERESAPNRAPPARSSSGVETEWL